MTGFLRIVYSAFTIVFLATTLQANSTIVPVIVDVEASGRGVVEITNLRTQPTPCRTLHNHAFLDERASQHHDVEGA